MNREGWHIEGKNEMSGMALTGADKRGSVLSISTLGSSRHFCLQQ